MKGYHVMKKSIAFVLALLAIMTAFVGCANVDDTPDPADTTVSDGGTQGVKPDSSSPMDTTYGNYDENGYIKDNIPDDESLEGETVTFLYWEDAPNTEFFAEDQNGESINDAIYFRNMTIEERLKVKLAFVPSVGKYEEQATFINKAQTDITSGVCEYDVLAAYSMTIASTAYNGMAVDLSQFDTLSFDMPWWPDTLLQESTIYDKLYFASGDISTNMLYMMYCCFFNKKQLEDNGLEDPYTLVDNNEWTLDKMIEMSANIYQDNNGDQIVNAEDIFAFSTGSTVHLDPFYYGSGLRTMEKNADGTPTISPDFSSERAVDVVNKVRAYLNDGNYAYYKDDDIFVEGRSLFTYERVQIASKSLKEVDFEFGIVPVPKYNSDQENYSTVLGFPYTLYCISAGSKKADAAALTLECMASESYRQITPVLFEESMKFKYASDNKTAQMYDILRETVSFDIGRIFTMSFDKITYQYFRNSVSSAGASDYSSAVKAKVRVLERLVENFSETFADMD